jgi:hypothetical protein
MNSSDYSPAHHCLQLSEVVGLFKVVQLARTQSTMAIIEAALCHYC